MPITETCGLKQDDIDAMAKEVPLQGCKILSKPRSGGRTGGGLASGVQEPLLCEGIGSY